MGHLYNIPAGASFARTLARELLRGAEASPEQLARVKIFLPTRRACRVLRDAFLFQNAGKPLLLPQMIPLGDVEEDELSLHLFGAQGRGLEIPPAISPLKRRILLARMIAANPAFGHGMDHALALAQALSRFLDQVIIEGLDFDDLRTLVPDNFAEHWKITLDFLSIITENWPKILAERGLIEPAAWRNILLHALADLWMEKPPETPVIAAGSTGSIPATANLLRVIADLPQGAVILPGLDSQMDAESWGAITQTHPQFGLKQLLERLGAARQDVKPYGGAKTQNAPRLHLASEMMRPAQTTQHWKGFAVAPAMLEGLEYYTAQTQQEEAQVIALIIRETLEQPEKTAALITPDRALARRVSALCRRWGIEVDDSAGYSLRESEIGKFALLCVRVAIGAYHPVHLLALLGHKLCALGAQHRGLSEELETDILRQDYVFTSLESLQQFLQDNRVKHTDIADFFDRFMQIIAPLHMLHNQRSWDFSKIVAAHIAVMEGLTQSSESSLLWEGDVGQKAAAFFADLQTHSDDFEAISSSEYEDILDLLMQNVAIRVPYGVHPRVVLLGQLEARLSSADCLILAGLNEGVWPQAQAYDPWLSRPMREDFGLPPPEKAIGLSAHDFVQGFCAPHVVVTRALRHEGAATTPARWLQRLEAVLKPAGLDLAVLQKKPYVAWAQRLDLQHNVTPYNRPEPRPPLSARPSGISITRVEQWIRDPYSIYAYDVLRVRKLRPLVQDNDVALKGTLLHDILDRFTHEFPEHLPPDAEGRLIEIAQELSAAHIQDQGFLRYWWPRFLKIASWVVAQERDWRRQARFIESELEGNADIDVDGTAFNLQGKPDRIDQLAEGYAIIDYKSGSSFTASKLRKGELPQLPLAAMILRRGGFDGKGLRGKAVDASKKRIGAGKAAYLGYWKMTGGRVAGGVEAIEEEDVETTTTQVEEGFAGLVRAYRDPKTAYYSIPDPSKAPAYNDYEHLARRKEWVVLDDETGEAEEA